MTFLLATAREDIAGYVRALIEVYVILIIAYILMTLFLQFGGRIPYSRWSRAIMDFLSQTVEPYLNLFRRFIPPLGPIDISPIVAILVLQIGGGIIAGLIEG
jgi:uncharacterized protein YggT (Ycf19 family)